MVVRALVVAAAVRGPHRLEGLGEGLGFTGEEAGKAQIAKHIEEALLLFRQRQGPPPSNLGTSLWHVVGKVNNHLLIANPAWPGKVAALLSLVDG